MIESLKLSESGALDILVACTGISGKLNPIHDCEIEELQNVVNTNFTANWYLLKNLDPMLKKSNAGRVIFMTSEVTLSPSSYPYWMPYAARPVGSEQAFPGSELVSPDKLTDKFVELASEDCSISGEILPLSKSPE
ncbi:oxidoreductase [Trichonephila clavata]|uniref:Oxidoreductase n=1 Tax=Trichonephila clavata TaxID=2740835 RepID=A0A8X6LBC7_TRICU|nr:oxidoreductase [Trichonephila clavata]